MLANGDKLVVTKNVMGILNEGDIVEIINANENGLIRFAFGDDFMHMGFMSPEECEKHFEKIVEKKILTITAEQIDKIMAEAEFSVETVFDKCTVVSCRLPNGFVIVESSACVSPENYDEEMGFEICYNKIENKLWELEGYRLQEELYRANDDMPDCEECFCDECDECPCAESYDDECLYTDLDCDECKDYDCPSNPLHHY